MRVPTVSCSTASASGTCRIAPLFALFMLVVVVATGCVGQHDPTSYGDKVRDNFVKGCVTGFASQDGKTPAASDRSTLCGCLYKEISNKSTGIPFDDFKAAQSKIRQDPTNPANAIDKLIPKFDQYLKTCEGNTTGPHT